jgi:hypothetical protein
MSAFEKTTRVCCLCGKALRPSKPGTPAQTTYDFETVLAKIGFKDRGLGSDKAHPSCITEYLMWPERKARS